MTARSAPAFPRMVLVPATIAAIIAISSLTLATPQQQQQEQQERLRPSFSGVVNRVRVSVIVTDDDGRFIDDLRAEDFRVFEDDEEREVLDVQLVNVAEGEVTPLRTVVVSGDAGDDPLPDEPVTAEVFSSEATVDAPAERFGAIVYFIDTTGLGTVTKQHFTHRWAKYLDTQTELKVPTAVYLVDSVGILREVMPLTTDIEKLRIAQQAVAGNPITQPGGGPGISETPGTAPIGAEGAPGGGPPTEASAADSRFRNFQEFNRAHYSFSLLAQFCDSLDARAGRTALVWISRGVTLRGTFQDRGFEPNNSLLKLQEQLHEAANSSNVSIYGVDPRRLIDVMGGPDGTRVGSYDDELSIPLRAAAKETGGKHFIAWADFGEVVAEIENDSSRYYLLTYPATDPRGDGEYREIRVEVERDDVSVRSTEGYTDHSEEDRRARFINAALTLPGTVNDIPVWASVFRSPADGDRTDVVIAVSVDGEHLGIQDDEMGEPMQRMEVHGALLDRNDDLKSVEEMGREVTEFVDSATNEKHDWLQSRQDWELEAGDYDLRLMVMDTATGGVGAVQFPLSIPELDDDEWAAGDVMIVETRDDETKPAAAGRVRAGSTVSAVVEVRNGIAPTVSGRLRTAEQSAGQGVPIMAAPMRESDGLHRGTITLPPIASGEYILDLRITDPAAERRHDARAAIRVAEASRR